MTADAAPASFFAFIGPSPCALQSNAKMRFQSFFMLITVQPFLAASSYSALMASQGAVAAQLQLASSLLTVKRLGLTERSATIFVQ